MSPSQTFYDLTHKESDAYESRDPHKRPHQPLQELHRVVEIACGIKKAAQGGYNSASGEEGQKEIEGEETFPFHLDSFILLNKE